MGTKMEAKRGPGRPPGSKNKAKETIDDLSPAIEPGPKLIEITITIPVMQPSEGAYTKRHIEVWLNKKESRAHRWLYDGLLASGAIIERRDSERDVRSSADVERWLMQAIEEALPVEEEKSEDIS